MPSAQKIHVSNDSVDPEAHFVFFDSLNFGSSEHAAGLLLTERVGLVFSYDGFGVGVVPVTGIVRFVRKHISPHHLQTLKCYEGGRSAIVYDGCGYARGLKLSVP